MKNKALMIQGAGSNVGKSLLVAGLCRAASQRGFKVKPFKPQNMSNNAAVALGGEIGRAQALQARAAKMPAHVDMNPVLLKPESEQGAQVILCGQRFATVKAKEYAKLRPQLLPHVMASFQRLQAEADLVLVEGAGSPAEVNLRQADIANMGFAEAADIPVVLVGDIDRGGVIAQLVGTQQVLCQADAARIKGFIINKFRGDPALFTEGYHFIQQRTNWPGFGVLPWFSAATKLPAEDSADLHSRQKQAKSSDGGFKIAVPVLERMANFDDLDPLAQEPNITLDLVEAGRALPGDADLVLLPGSKSTCGDLAFLRAQGWDIDLTAHYRRGGQILGLCGGYQMLGRVIHDPNGVEGLAGSITGLGLLDIETVMTADKTVQAVCGQHIASGASVQGYEIHLGQTTGPDCERPLLMLEGRAEGAMSLDGLISGCYCHGLFASDAFRQVFLQAASRDLCFEAEIETTLDALAMHLEQHLDIEALLKLAQ